MRENKSYKRFGDSAECRVGRSLDITTGCYDTDRAGRRQHITGRPAL